MFDKKFTDEIFPQDRTDAFFDALFGGTEDGAYDISLSFQNEENGILTFHFELKQRQGHCLRCNLTTGLPQVFERHPIIGTKVLVDKIAQKAGLPDYTWKLGSTIQYSEELHAIPLYIQAK